jgi:hypothetical protein
MNTRKLIIGLAAALALIIAPLGLSAGEDEKNLHRMFHVKVKPGHSPQFFEAFAKHMEWRKANGETWTWWVHSVVSGPDHGDCIIRSGPISWADVDAYEAFLDKGGVEFWKTCGEHIKDVNSWFSMMDDRWVRWLPEGKDVNLVQVVTYDLKPGMAETFSNAIQQYHDTIVAEDYPTYYVFDWNLAGGDGNTVTLAILMESWADMQPAEETVQAMMARVLGEDEAKALGESFTSSYTSAQSSVVRYLDALSIQQESEE